MSKISAVEFTVKDVFQQANNSLQDCVDFIFFFFFPFQNTAVAFSALVHALDELKVVAVVRYAYDRRSNPQIGAAFPCIKDAYEVIFHSYLSVKSFHTDALQIPINK